MVFFIIYLFIFLFVNAELAICNNEPGMFCMYPNSTHRINCDMGVCDYDNKCIYIGGFQCPDHFICSNSVPFKDRCQPIYSVHEYY